MLYLFSFFFFFSVLVPQELAEDEIGTPDRVNFQNSSRQRASQILIQKNFSDGKYLSEEIKKQNFAETSEVIVQNVLPTETKLGADIISLKSSFYYGHINVLRRILQSYIENRFEYGKKEAEILTNFILYYNALNRDKYDYIIKRYNPGISNIIEKNKIGISLNYSEWKENTQIIIPMTDNILKEENPDVADEEIKKATSLATSKEKKKFENFEKEKIKKEDILVNKKLKETGSELEELKKAEKAIIKSIEKDRKENLSKSQNTEQKLIKEKPEESNQNKLQDIQKKIENLNEKKDKLEEKKEEIESKKKDNKIEINTNNETEKNTDNEIEKKLQKAEKELEELKEEKEKKENFDKNVVNSKIIYLNTIKYLDKGHYNNEIQIIDTEKDDTILKSSFTDICSKNFELFQEKILVISFEKNHSNKHKLTLIDQNNLLPIQSSEIDVFWRSPIIVKNKEIYVFEMKNKKVYFTKLDENLAKISTTSHEINPNSNVTFFGEKIYLNSKNKKNQMDILVINKEDLQILKRIIQ